MTLQKIGEGQEAEMFAWEEDKILRLYRPGVPRTKVEFQLRAMKVARNLGVCVPEVFEILEVNGRQGVVMEKIEGTDLLTLIGLQPWHIRSIGRVIALAHAEIHMIAAPDAVPRLIPQYERLIGSARDMPAAFAAAALQRLKELPQGERLLHGDFHPGNIIMRHGRPVVIDWSSIASGSPEADVARTRMLLQLGEPTSGSPVVVRLAALFARSILLNAYVQAYRSCRAIDEVLLEAWELPVAVARLAEDIGCERKRLIPYIEKRLYPLPKWSR